MTRSMNKLNVKVADLENVPGFDFDQIRIAQPGNSLDTLGFILVDIDSSFDSTHQVGRALNVLPHHVAAKMILVIMSYQDFLQVISFVFRVSDNSLNVPRRVD